MTLRRKLLLWYSGIFFLSAAFLVTTLYFLISHKTRKEFFHYFREEYEEARCIVEENFNDPQQLRDSVDVEVGGRKFFPLSYELYDVKERKVVLSMAPDWKDRLPPLPSEDKIGGGTDTARLSVGDGRDDIIYLRTGWVDREELPNLILRVGMSYERVYKRLDKLGEYLSYALVLSVLLSVLGGKFLAARSLAPIDEVAASLERIEAHRLADRLEETKVQDEVGRIVSAVNRMLSRLEDSFDRIGRFAADAAHELRTPLSTLKCRLEVELERPDLSEESREALSNALEQAEEQIKLVDKLLFLARLDAADKLEEPKAIDVGDVLEDIGEIFEVVAAQKGVQLELDRQGSCVVQGDRTLLRQLFANLIDNAISYTPSDGRVTVSVAEEGGMCRIAVADTGVGIDQGDLDKVFDRFYRTEQSRSRETGGTGLGLSICQGIAELHRGTIRIDSERGVGTTVTVSLPMH